MRLIRFGWRRTRIISFLARHVEKLVRAIALGINFEALSSIVASATNSSVHHFATPFLGKALKETKYC